jgi:hypothetical protein
MHFSRAIQFINPRFINLQRSRAMHIQSIPMCKCVGYWSMLCCPPEHCGIAERCRNLGDLTDVLQGPEKATIMPTWSPMSRQRSRSSLILPTLQSTLTYSDAKFLTLRNVVLRLNLISRVAPELKSQISAGKIDLTAIVNTHQ